MRRAAQRVWNYLGSDRAFDSGPRKWATLLLLGAWLGSVCFVSYHHEIWRDEARAYSVATQTESLADLVRELKLEGHPILWYALLRYAHVAVQDPVVLKIASIACASLAMIVLFAYAPFRNWLKLLFLFSVFPSYFYSVHARSYSLVMLLAFLLAALYPERREKPWTVALLWICLANTHAMAFALCVLILPFVYGGDLYRTTTRRQEGSVWALALPFLVILLGMGAAALTAYPDSSTLVRPHLDWASIQRAATAFATHPAEIAERFRFVLPPWPPAFTGLVLVGLGLGLLRHRASAILYTLGTLGLAMFFVVVYGWLPIHQGVLILLIVSLYWVAARRIQGEPGAEGTSAWLLWLWRGALHGLLPVVLIYQVGHTVDSWREDIRRPYSASKALAAFIEQDPQYSQAILTGDPDVSLDSLPYYLENPIYLVRERTFRRWVHLVEQRPVHLELATILRSAKALRQQFDVPILVLLGLPNPFTHERAGVARFGKNSFLHWNEKTLAEFRGQMQPVAHYPDAISDERYDVFLLR